MICVEPRQTIIHHRGPYPTVAFLGQSELDEANATLIIKSVNEAPLLQAVVDAAKKSLSALSRLTHDDLERELQAIRIALKESLAALAAHRNGGGE